MGDETRKSASQARGRGRRQALVGAMALAVAAGLLVPVGTGPADAAARPAAPRALKVIPKGTHRALIDWVGSSSATAYTVRLSTSKTGRAFWARRTTATSFDAQGLTHRVFWVTVIAHHAGQPSTAAKPIMGGTATPKPSSELAFTAKVGSYNVQRYDYGKPWMRRLPGAAARIRDFDIVGIQESTWGGFAPALSGMNSLYSKRPIEQLAHVSGLTLPRNPADPYKPCSLHSVHILIRASMFHLVRCGTRRVSYDKRYVTWAEIEHRASGRHVLVVNTHLMDGASNNAQRATEAREILALIGRVNVDHLPVIMTGDLNSVYGRASTTPMSLLFRGGFYSADLAAGRQVRTTYATVHDFKPTKHNRFHLDYVMTRGRITLDRFEVRWSTESTAPSDHHPVMATVSVYR